MFDKKVLAQLKKEFGGLQTLLRNEHQVFNGVCVHTGINIMLSVDFLYLMTGLLCPSSYLLATLLLL